MVQMSFSFRKMMILRFKSRSFSRVFFSIMNGFTQAIPLGEAIRKQGVLYRRTYPTGKSVVVG